MSIFEALLWITLNVYHEARSDDLIGKKAVAHVTMNRVKARGLSVKETVQQPAQFSWVKQVKNHVPAEWDAFMECFKAVTIAINEPDFTRGADHYHLASMDPYPPWASKLEFIAQFGSHRFYRDMSSIPHLRAKKIKIRR